MKDKETIRAMEMVLTEVANLLGTPQGNVEAMGDEIRSLQADKEKWMEVAEASASIKARHDALDRENAELKAQRDGLQMAIDDLLCEDHRTCGEIHALRQKQGGGCLICLITRLRDKHYRECEEIARNVGKMRCDSRGVDPETGTFNHGGDHIKAMAGESVRCSENIADEIARAREGK